MNLSEFRSDSCLMSFVRSLGARTYAIFFLSLTVQQKGAKDFLKIPDEKGMRRHCVQD